MVVQVTANFMGMLKHNKKVLPEALNAQSMYSDQELDVVYK